MNLSRRLFITGLSAAPIAAIAAPFAVSEIGQSYLPIPKDVLAAVHAAGDRIVGFQVSAMNTDSALTFINKNMETIARQLQAVKADSTT